MNKLSLLLFAAALLFIVQGCSTVRDYETPRNALRAKGISFTVKEFMMAASDGKNDVLELFLDGGMDINTLDDGTVLTAAVVGNRKETVDFVLKKGADPNLSSYRGSPLFLASKMGFYDVALRLVQEGAEPEYAKNDGSTPLSEAVRNNHLEVAELLIKAGADPELGDSMFKRTPVFLAAANGNAEMIEILCDNGADPKEADIYETTPLDNAVVNGGKEAVLLLLEKGAALTEDGNASKAVLDVCSRKNLALLKLFIEKGLNVNCLAPLKVPLLSGCIKNGYYDPAKILLSSGADLQLEDAQGELPLDYAMNSSPEFLAYFKNTTGKSVPTTTGKSTESAVSQPATEKPIVPADEVKTEAPKSP